MTLEAKPPNLEFPSGALQHATHVLAEWGQRFAASGGWKIYLVGGVVRDLLLGEELTPEREVDMTTDARPEEVEQVLRGWTERIWTQGSRFGTVGCIHRGRVVEVTTHRSDIYSRDSRKPRVNYSTDVLVDLSRRDFTINAMAVQLPSSSPPEVSSGRLRAPRLIDPHGGLDDLRMRRLRTPLTPSISFEDDPLRMLRAARFVACMGLSPEPALKEAMRNMAGRLEITSRERIRSELELLLSSPAPGAGIKLLAQAGLLAHVFPQCLSSLAHRLVDAVASHSGEISLRLAALLWQTTGVESMLRSLRFSAGVARSAEAVGRKAEDLLGVLDRTGASPPDAALRRWAADAPHRSFAALTLARAVVSLSAGVDGAALIEALTAFTQRFGHLESQEKLTSPSAPLTGKDVIAELGTAPGPLVGEALQFLEEVRIEEGPLSREAARYRLSEWYRRGAKTP